MLDRDFIQKKKKNSWKRGLIFTLRNLEPKLTSEIYKKQVCSIPCFHPNCLGEKSADRSLKAIQYGSSKGPPTRFWGSKDLPTSFFPVTSTNIRNSPQAFLTRSFISFTFRTSQKMFFFWSNPYKIVMITSLIEMLELPNVGRMTSSMI